MIAHIKGTVFENHPSYIIVDVQNVGYQVFVPPGTISQLKGEECFLYTSLVTREMSQTLYGFKDKITKELFEMLISISGVGPKTALCILSRFEPHDLQQAVLQANVKQISSVPGIGKKTAERLIIDIKDKLNKLSIANGHDVENGHLHDAILALVNLGFTQANAKAAIEKVMKHTEEQLELSELITHALRHG